MKLDDTKIPASKQKDFYAILKEMRAFQNKGVLGRCMFWSGDCEDSPIASHLLSESWLRQIADSTNHVVQFELVASNVARNGATMEARRVGVGQMTAVTFPGFCNKHDSALFRCLDQGSFLGTPEQLLALTYRSTCREACAKHQMLACNLPRALDEAAPPFLTLQAVSEMKNYVRLLAWKQELEEMLMGGKNELAAFVVQFAVRPSLLASATFSFPMTFTGRRLDARYEWMTLSILPSGNAGVAIFTWSKRAPKNPSLLVKSFKSIPRELQSAALVNLILEVSENLFVAPVWWDGLHKSLQASLLARFSRSLTTGNPVPLASSLTPKSPPMVDWKTVNSAYA